MSRDKSPVKSVIGKKGSTQKCDGSYAHDQHEKNMESAKLKISDRFAPLIENDKKRRQSERERSERQKMQSRQQKEREEVHEQNAALADLFDDKSSGSDGSESESDNSSSSSSSLSGQGCQDRVVNNIEPKL